MLKSSLGTMDKVRRTLSHEEEQIWKIKAVTQDGKRIKEVKVVGSIPMKTGLVIRSDLHIWCMLRSVPCGDHRDKIKKTDEPEN